ncbi:GAF domain-containing protein [bacterium]|nr:GAF domain-containing protein [bacterium]
MGSLWALLAHWCRAKEPHFLTRSIRQVLARLERLEVLYKISNIVNTTLEPQEVLRLLLLEVVRITNATSGSIALVDHRKGVLNIETAINIPPRLWKSLKLQLGVGVTGYVAWTGKPLRVDEVEKNPHYVRLKSDIRSEMALPMLLDGKVIGVINVDSTRPSAFTADDEDLGMAVANQSVKVLETARLHTAIKRQANELETLFTVGRTLIQPGPLEDLLDRIAAESLQAIGGKVCVVMRVTETRDLVNVAAAGASQPWRDAPAVRIDNSLLGTVVKKCQPLRVPDVQKSGKFQNVELAEQEGVRSLLAVPVIFQDEVLAVLAVYTEDQRRFRESEVRLLQLIANQGAMAIENSRRMERLQLLEDNLRQAERFSLLGTLAAEIAHEIRNPITIINLLMHSIREAPGQTEQTRNDVAIVTEKLERINQIVEQTLNMARSSESRRVSTQINQLVEELLLFLNYKLTKAHIGVELTLDPKLPPIAVDPGQVQQVLLNLMVNALESMKPGGTLRVKTRLASDRALGPCVRCVVEDTGVGIPVEHIESIFNPFFTTRPDGTGLGLFISNKLVRRHGGTIRVKSQPGVGSAFTVTLPLNQEAGEA